MGCFWHYLHSVEGLSWLLEHVCFVISPCCLPDISNYYMPNHYQRWWWATTQKSNNARVFWFFFFLFSKCIICNFSRQRKKIWHCVSTHGALTGGLRPDQHIFALLARFGSLGLHPPSSLKQKSTWRSIVLSQRSRAKAHVQVVKTELPSSDLKRVSSIVILLFTCVVLSSLLRLLSILCFSSLLS